MAVNGLRVHGVVLLLLAGISYDLDGFGAPVHWPPPAEDPHLVKMGNIVQVNWKLVCDHNLQRNVPSLAKAQFCFDKQ